MRLGSLSIGDELDRRRGCLLEVDDALKGGGSSSSWRLVGCSSEACPGVLIGMALKWIPITSGDRELEEDYVDMRRSSDGQCNLVRSTSTITINKTTEEKGERRSRRNSFHFVVSS